MKKLTLTLASAALVLGLGSAAGAVESDGDVDNYGGNIENPAPPAPEGPEVKGIVPTASAPSTPSVAAPAVEVKAAQQLPVTGGEATTLALIGTALVAGGGVLVWRSKGAEAAA